MTSKETRAMRSAASSATMFLWSGTELKRMFQEPRLTEAHRAQEVSITAVSTKKELYLCGMALFHYSLKINYRQFFQRFSLKNFISFLSVMLNNCVNSSNV